jgi:3-oxoacyl-[acyl-carrier protein] reductase
LRNGEEVVPFANQHMQWRSALPNMRGKGYLSRMAAGASLRRLSEPKEIADTIIWLASDRASCVTGQTVLVDGGFCKGL